MSNSRCRRIGIFVQGQAKPRQIKIMCESEVTAVNHLRYLTVAVQSFKSDCQHVVDHGQDKGSARGFGHYEKVNEFENCSTARGSCDCVDQGIYDPLLAEIADICICRFQMHA